MVVTTEQFNKALTDINRVFKNVEADTAKTFAALEARIDELEAKLEGKADKTARKTTSKSTS